MGVYIASLTLLSFVFSWNFLDKAAALILKDSHVAVILMLHICLLFWLVSCVLGFITNSDVLVWMIFWGVILNHHLVFFLPLHQILLHLLANILLGFPYAPLQDKAFRVCFVLHWVEPWLESFHNVYNLLFNSSLNHRRILHATRVDHIPWRIIKFAHFSVQIDNVTRCERLLPASLKFLFNFVSERLAASFW